MITRAALQFLSSCQSLLVSIYGGISDLRLSNSLCQRDTNKVFEMKPRYLTGLTLSKRWYQQLYFIINIPVPVRCSTNLGLYGRSMETIKVRDVDEAQPARSFPPLAKL
jgi:hypothetical protein